MKAVATIILLLNCAGVSPAVADTVVMKDGGVRQGVIESKNPKEIRLRMERDGIRAIVVIRTADVARIEEGPSSPNDIAPPSLATLPSNVSSGSESVTPAGPVAGRTPPEFLTLASSFSRSPGFGQLPVVQRELIARATQASQEPAGAPTPSVPLPSASMSPTERGGTARLLRALYLAAQFAPDGALWLDDWCQRERKEPFGLWMAQSDWEFICEKYRTGQFDLKDVWDVEKPFLIGILKEKTPGAVDPLQPYFPPVNTVTGLSAPFRPAQLQGITAGNALEVKDKATYASAVLLAQLKLEPQMPTIDRQVLLNQLVMVNRVLSRSRELELPAKMALERAETERKAAEEKARRDAALQKQRAGTPAARGG